ncbi:MAG: DUF2339 domain-containing protein [Bacteroidetes bacterium]|nr:hypothetical protein [Flavobacteriales bacterium]NOG95379.1 DUF2339 domain-containing protein [Bacteroidota bacterium]WKZ76373.1 MAG: DUF2339 domain-containing protein [Vicingaceae bacterium]MCL4816293.1 DUF2339 domain-containing protein [Flavobacteriales bacterium]CAG0968045.1 hypothetical protein FLAV_01071 [Flavobacteriales bacterium]
MSATEPNNIEHKIKAVESKIDALQKELYLIKEELRGKMAATENTTVPVYSKKQDEKPIQPVPLPTPTPPSAPKPKKQNTFQLENFIGKNLLSIVGIAVTVIGIGIGVKYAIDNELINPLTRIILGYIAGLAITITALKLKNKYTYFSAVLLSGAMASFYFITFAAYSFYDLLPQLLAFILMVLFTVFTVFASIRYNIQIIAHLALVGAYAVPFLLSDGSGKVLVLFSYMTITNIGILVLAFLRNWRLLNLTSSFLTWIIVCTWYVASYKSDIHLSLLSVFGTLFFLLFYTAVLAYKVKRDEKFSIWDTLVILMNSFFYFGIMVAALSSKFDGQWDGAFCLANALLHFGVTAYIFKKNLADKKLFYLTAAMVLMFLTITFPVQLNGPWVTIAWMCEAVILFYIGRSQKVFYYEILSYILAFTGLIGLAYDWITFYDSYQYYSYYGNVLDVENDTPHAFFNIQFLSSLIICGTWFLLWKLNHQNKTEIADRIKPLQNVLNYIFSSLFFLLFYYSIYYEIDLYWKLQFIHSAYEINGYTEYDYTYRKIGEAWIYTFTGFYLLISGLINVRFYNQKINAIVLWSLMMIYALSFITDHLFNLSSLLREYLNAESAHFRNIYLLLVRYISLLGISGLLFVKYKNRSIAFPEFSEKYKYYFLLFTHFVVLTLLSSELKTIMKLTTGTYPLTISILWGIYALLLVVYGLKQNIKVNRIAGFILFFASLCKILISDIQVSSTIGKTIVFISLGVLLLLTSFLYQKLNKKINNDENK